MSRTGKERYAHVVLARIERDDLGGVALHLLHPDLDVEVTAGAEFARVALAQDPWRNWKPTTLGGLSIVKCPDCDETLGVQPGAQIEHNADGTHTFIPAGE